jgi:hypothetical protein
MLAKWRQQCSRDDQVIGASPEQDICCAHVSIQVGAKAFLRTTVRSQSQVCGRT